MAHNLVSLWRVLSSWKDILDKATNVADLEVLVIVMALQFLVRDHREHMACTRVEHLLSWHIIGTWFHRRSNRVTNGRAHSVVWLALVESRSVLLRVHQDRLVLRRIVHRLHGYVC